MSAELDAEMQEEAHKSHYSFANNIDDNPIKSDVDLKSEWIESVSTEPDPEEGGDA